MDSIYNVFYDKTSIGSPNHWDKAYVYFKTMRPLIESACEYSGEKSILESEFEKNFTNGAIYVYSKDQDSQLSLYIQAQSIEKKLIKVLFINMLKYLDTILLKKKAKPIEFDHILKSVIYARCLFTTLSENIGNEEVKTAIIKEIGKSMTFDKKVIIDNVILYVFCNEIEKSLRETVFESQNDEYHNTLQKAIWEAYFYYSIFDFDYKIRMGEQETEMFKKEWAYLINVTKDFNHIEDLKRSIETIFNHIYKYKASMIFSLEGSEIF